MRIWSIVYCDKETEYIFSSEKRARDFMDREKLEYGVYYLTVATVNDETQNPQYVEN